MNIFKFSIIICETKKSTAPQYSQLLGKWILVNKICSDGKPAYEANDLSSIVEFSEKQIVMSFVDKKKPSKPEIIELKRFVLQDNLLSYWKDSTLTVELRLLDNTNLMIRSPLVGLSGDCESSNALMEMTYRKL